MSTLENETVVLFTIFHKICPTRHGDVGKVKSDAEKSSLRLTKTIIKSKHLVRINGVKDRTKKLIARYALPSPFKENSVLIPKAVLPLIYDALESAEKEYAEHADAFAAEWQLIIDDARDRLADMFDKSDYESAKSIRKKFWVEYRLVNFKVPNGANVPEALRDREAEKARKEWESATQEVTLALQTGFNTLLTKLIGQLNVGPEGSKTKVTTAGVNAVKDFLDTFSKRNVLKDKDLAELVTRARKVLENESMEDLRDEVGRIGVQKKLKRIGEGLSSLITSQKRAFDFGD